MSQKSDRRRGSKLNKKERDRLIKQLITEVERVTERALTDMIKRVQQAACQEHR